MLNEWIDRHSRLVLCAALALLVLVLGFATVMVLGNWRTAEGHEFYTVGISLAQGHGFSFPGHSRHLFEVSNATDRTDPNAFYPTAWVSPIVPMVIGASLWMFEDYGVLILLLANVVMFGATLVVVYYLGRRIGGNAVGLAAAGLLGLLPGVHRQIYPVIGDAAIAGLLLGVCALVTLWCLEAPSLRRALIVGGVSGVCALTHAAALILIPTIALLVLLARGFTRLAGWGCAVAVVVAATLVIAPWTIRNYAHFDELVPVRSGFGSIAYVGNPAFAATVDAMLVPENGPLEVPWTAASVWRAWDMVRVLERQRELIRYGRGTVKLTTAGFAELNEAERDKAMLARAKEFMLEHPATVLELMLVKAYAFFLSRRTPAVVAGLAGLGLLLAFRDYRVRALALMAFAYSIPYLVSMPYYYRYRYPIEPLMVVLAAVAVVHVVDSLWSRLGRHREPVIRTQRSSDSLPSRS